MAYYGDDFDFSKYKNNDNFIIVSTPYKAFGAFYDIWQNAKNDNIDNWNAIEILWNESFNDNIRTKNWANETRNVISTNYWDRECECKFLTD
jgi:hypothetical protein